MLELQGASNKYPWPLPSDISIPVGKANVKIDGHSYLVWSTFKGWGTNDCSAYTSNEASSTLIRSETSNAASSLPYSPGSEPWMPGLSPPLFFTLAPSHCSPKCHSRSRWLVAYMAPASGKIIAENLKNHASSVSLTLPGVLGSFLPTELVWTTLLSLECLTFKGRAVAGSSGPSLPKDYVFFRKIPTSCSQHYRF